MHFFKETWTSNMRTTTTMTLSKVSQRNQFPTRSANQFPNCLESCNWSTISTVLSKPQEDGIIVLPPISETWEAKNLSWNQTCGLFRDENGVIHALCSENVDDFMLTCSDSLFGKHVFDNNNNLCEW